MQSRYWGRLFLCHHGLILGDWDCLICATWGSSQALSIIGACHLRLEHGSLVARRLGWSCWPCHLGLFIYLSLSCRFLLTHWRLELEARSILLSLVRPLSLVVGPLSLIHSLYGHRHLLVHLRNAGVFSFHHIIALLLVNDFCLPYHSSHVT